MEPSAPPRTMTTSPGKNPVFRSLEGEVDYMAAYGSVLKEWPTGYEELYVRTRLGRTHIVASGQIDRPPVILLHPSGAASMIWYRNVKPLGERFRVFAVDTIGEPGKSVLDNPIKASNQREQYAEWFADILDGLNISSAHVVGNSFGGFLALNAVITRPERILKTVLISPAASFTQMWSWYWHFVPAGLVGRLVRWDRILLAPIDWIWNGLPQDDKISRLRSITATRGLQRHGFPSVFDDSELQRIRKPILLLVGDREVIYDPKRVIEKARRLVDGLEAEIIPNGNHNAEYTASDAVNESVLRFLDRPWE